MVRGTDEDARNDDRMPVGLTAVNVLRFAAGVLTALWAIAGLTVDYAALAGGAQPREVVDIAANVLLAFGASLALVDAGGWQRMLLIALVIATIERIAVAMGSGAAVAQIAGTALAFVAIAAVTYASLRKSGPPR